MTRVWSALRAHALAPLTFALMFAAAPPASAHPMGTLSTNRSAVLRVAPDAATLDYTVDFAEIPAVAELTRLRDHGPEAYASERMAELLPGLHLAVDGAERPLTAETCLAQTASGEAGLEVVALWCRLRAALPSTGALALTDANFAGAPGWREMRIVADGTEVGAVEPAIAAAEGNPRPFASDPATMTVSSLRARLGTAGAPIAAATAPSARAPDAFAGLVGGDLSFRFVVLALFSAMALGAGHALSPGHGKTIVAAYLVGSRGTIGQALLLGLVVTLTHVSSVLLLGAVTLWLSAYVVAAELFPWIGVASGLGVVAVGAGLLRARFGRWRNGQAHDHGHGAHDHAHGAHDHDHGEHGHDHVIRDDRGEPVGLWRLLVLGVSGGAVPCPSALVVLLAAIALHRVAFGMLLIVAFSMGLAGVLMVIGVMVVRAGALLDRLSGGRKAAAWLPVASAAVVMTLGLAIALQSAREGGLL